MAVRDYCWESVICGYHIYKTILTPEIGEILHCEQEEVIVKIHILLVCSLM